MLLGGAGAGRVFKLPESAPFGTDRGGDEKGSSTLLRHSVHQHNFSLKSSLTILYQRNLKLNWNRKKMAGAVDGDLEMNFHCFSCTAHSAIVSDTIQLSTPRLCWLLLIFWIFFFTPNCFLALHQSCIHSSSYFYSFWEKKEWKPRMKCV